MQWRDGKQVRAWGESGSANHYGGFSGGRLLGNYLKSPHRFPTDGDVDLVWSDSYPPRRPARPPACRPPTQETMPCFDLC
jgi:hypothetical protein